MKILVKRAGAFGDVLATTPVVARLRKENPGAIIDIETDHTAAYFQNPHIQAAMRSDHPYFKLAPGFDRVIDLNGAYEKDRRLHAIDAYMEIAFGDRGGDRQIVFDFNREAMPPPLSGRPWDETVVLHPAISWPQRTLSRSWWRSLAKELLGIGWGVYFVGTEQDRLRELTMPVHLHTTRHQAAIINAAACFVCSDSGLLTLAHATKAPIVGLFTMTRPELVTYDRQGQRGWQFFPIVADIECAGCGELETEVRSYFPCRFGHNNCVNSFEVGKVVDAVEKATLPF